MTAGERRYEDDAYCRSLRARVLSCQPVEGGFEVELTDTVLYPEGGGQPSDAGRIGDQPVLAVTRASDGRVLHRLARPVEGEVEVELDWPRRYDHMQQHTAQHVLTSLALSELGWATTAFHLGPQRSDLELAADGLDLEALSPLASRANQVIRQARPVRAFWVERDELERLPVRSRILPEGLSGPLRLVEIEGVDLNTCCGTHVASTAELQAIALVGTERLRGGTRVFFLSGGRLLAEVDRAVAQHKALNDLLSCGPADHPAAVSRLQAAIRDAGLQKRRLEAELAEELAARLAAGGQPACLQRAEADMGFMQSVARAFLRLRPDGLALLTGGQRQGFFVLAGPEVRLDELGAVVAAALHGRGGSGAGLYQGKAERLDLLERALEELARHISIIKTD
ncbi:MAG: alanyl-tRNA editing protein [Deltaproteobacteria bacterium]|nr:alanyl-tRNA editing protein [Deltaproteobacteria bacterium]